MEFLERIENNKTDEQLALSEKYIKLIEKTIAAHFQFIIDNILHGIPYIMTAVLP